MLLWKYGIAFRTLEDGGDAFAGVLVEVLQQQLLLLENRLTRTLKNDPEKEKNR